MRSSSQAALNNVGVMHGLPNPNDVDSILREGLPRAAVDRLYTPAHNFLPMALRHANVPAQPLKDTLSLSDHLAAGGYQSASWAR
eukprot:jgi/Chrzof1/9591/Cz04g08190.t1